MPALAEAITRYHRLIEQNGFGDAAWCEQLQERMRQMHLTDSGRLLSPILRPFFLTGRQAESLARTAEHFSAILDKTQDMVMASPALLSRVQMLPAEKMLAALPSGSAHLSVTCRLDALLSKNSLSLVGFDTCQPSGLMYASLLADLFLDLPLVKEFKRSGYKVTKLGAPRQFYNSLLAAWREFGGKGTPVIAIVECPLPAGSTSSEGQLMADSLMAHGADARLVPPENLRYSDGRLWAGPLSIDLVFRRILTREILTRWELSHPLLQAYREGAVCVVNSFRSEMGRRRAMLELLSDPSFIARFPAADRKLIGSLVPWTRVVSARKTKYGDTAVDLLDYISQNREPLVLLPNEDTPQERAYIGAEMTQTAWERALRAAQRSPYVVQERSRPALEQFPFFQYGEFKVAEAEVILQPQLLAGKLAGAAALLTKSSGGSPTTLGLAPVLLLE
jgi:hypothetical protein